jgi:hypothetical protein
VAHLQLLNIWLSLVAVAVVVTGVLVAVRVVIKPQADLQ